MILSGRHKACTQCRDRKIRCDGAQPKCRGCARHGHECYYAPAAKRYSKADFAVMLEGMNRRILQAEAAVTATSTVNSAAALPWSSLPPASTAQTTPSGVSPELAFPFGSPFQAAANSDFAIALDGMNKRLLPTGAGSANPASGRPGTSDLNFDFNSSFQPPASSAPAAVHESDSNNQLGAVPSQSAHFGFRDHSDTPFGSQSSAFESAHQPLPLFGGLNFGFHFDPSASGGLNNSHTTTGPSDSVISHPQQFPISPAAPAEKRRRVSADQDDWWPCDNDRFDQAAPTHDNNNNNDNRRQGSTPNTVTSRSQPAGPGSQDSRSRQSGSRAMSQSSETATGSAQYTNSTSVTPNTSPMRTSSPVLNQCSSSMRRKIGTGASFQALPTLTGPENYSSWVRAIRAAARKEGVWDMMTGVCERPSTPRPDASPTSKQRHNDDMTYWLNKRELALGAIEGSLADDLQARIENIECAREVWLTLERECKVSKEQALLDAIKRLRNLSGEASVGGIERLACRIQELRADMQCITALPQVPEWYFAVQFLISLPPVFDGLVSSVTSLSPCTIDLGSDGSLEQVVALAKAEEKRIFASAS
ncbi:hypothetical protein Micbo1qcDRAFT_236424 [Microdochium bolleyi]|uniref:Zn(2)-C6 fungal-type domain-containing protein n=1 Tax=Microdochium bolleyi TaxID=196109 RepID=A0A136IQK1_9PEZI|nr:hypothetical protein Micbo1qcDRAFT_236424 [Microdochium bolleyi]